MRNFEQRIKRVEEELNIGGPDESAQEEAYRKANPFWCQVRDEYHEKHQNDPDYVRDMAEGKLSDKTINQMADYYFRRFPEMRGDPQYAHLFPPNQDEDKIKLWVSSWKNYWKARDEEKQSVS